MNPSSSSATSWDETCDLLVKAMKKDSDRDQIQELVSQLKDPNASHIHREAEFTLLFHASLRDCEEAFKALLQKGANPAYKNSNGTTVLSLLVKRSQCGLIEACIEEIGDPERVKAWINSASKSGWTPVMAAANGRDEEVLQLLLKHGGNPNQQMSTGWTAMHAAAKTDNVGAFQALLEAGGNPALRACHRQFGEDVTCTDVTTNSSILNLMQGFAECPA